MMGGVHYGSFLQHHPVLPQTGLDLLKQSLPQFMPLQQVAKVQ